MFSKISPYLATVALSIVAVLIANYIQRMIDEKSVSSGSAVSETPQV